MIDADGNPVTVSFDEDLNVIATQTDGPGFGHHRGDGEALESEA
jgi:hypothetical protein